MRKSNIAILITAAVVASCVTYEPATIRALDEIEVTVSSLYHTFQDASLDDEAIQSVRAKLVQYQAAQAARGAGNRLQIDQSADILALFNLQVSQRRDSGPWNETMIRLNQENFGRAVRSARRIERAKRGGSPTPTEESP